MISLKVKGNWAENYIEEAMINLKTQEQDSNNGHTKEEKKIKTKDNSNRTINWTDEILMEQSFDKLVWYTF